MFPISSQRVGGKCVALLRMQLTMIYSMIIIINSKNINNNIPAAAYEFY